jgi:hypothetical protein
VCADDGTTREIWREIAKLPFNPKVVQFEYHPASLGTPAQETAAKKVEKV